MHQLETINEIITTSEELSLYKKLVLQLNKDFLRANIAADFKEDIQPKKLILQLQETIFKFINKQFSEYLNLLYIVDVSEVKMKNIDTKDFELMTEQVTFLILLREWEKVWFKENYSE